MIPHAPGVAAEQAVVVSESSPITLVCEIESFEDPIRGRVRNDAGRTVAFRGWIELASALSVAASGTAHDIPENQEQPHVDL